MKQVIFCGYHHTGKTTLLVRAIGPLARRGYRVGVVKHASGRLDFEAKGKDLSRYMTAGAVEVHILSLFPGDSAGEGDGLDFERVLSATSADFLLIEGFKAYRGPLPRIVFGKNRKEIERLMGGGAAGYSGFGLGEPPFIRKRSAEKRQKSRRVLKPPARSARYLPMDIEPEALADFLEAISRRETTGSPSGTFRF